VSSAVQVLTGKGSGYGMGVGDVLGECWIQVIWVLVWEAVWLEDGELVCSVGVRVQEWCKIQMRDGGPFGFRAEAGSSALVTQLDCCWSDCTWFALICSF